MERAVGIRLAVRIKRDARKIDDPIYLCVFPNNKTYHRLIYYTNHARRTRPPTYNSFPSAWIFIYRDRYDIILRETYIFLFFLNDYPTSISAQISDRPIPYLTCNCFLHHPGGERNFICEKMRADDDPQGLVKPDRNFCSACLTYFTCRNVSPPMRWNVRRDFLVDAIIHPRG